MKQLLITAHGIRTFGEWQERLSVLITEARPGAVEQLRFKYGFFSVLQYVVPFLREFKVRHFVRELEEHLKHHHYDRIDVVSHSFGTHIVANGIKRIAAKKKIRIHTVILAGSVLRHNFPWRNLIDRGCVHRVINECGTKDTVLLINQLLVLFAGSAGRFGFSGLMSSRFCNREYPFGHSGYFENTRGQPDDSFMKSKWIPLLTTEDEVELETRPAPTVLGGAKEWALRNLEPLKMLMWMVPFLFVVQVLRHQRNELSLQLQQARFAEAMRLIESDTPNASLSSFAACLRINPQHKHARDQAVYYLVHKLESAPLRVICLPEDIASESILSAKVGINDLCLLSDDEETLKRSELSFQKNKWESKSYRAQVSRKELEDEAEQAGSHKARDVRNAILQFVLPPQFKDQSEGDVATEFLSFKARDLLSEFGLDRALGAQASQVGRSFSVEYRAPDGVALWYNWSGGAGEWGDFLFEHLSSIGDLVRDQDGTFSGMPAISEDGTFLAVLSGDGNEQSRYLKVYSYPDLHEKYAIETELSGYSLEWLPGNIGLRIKSHLDVREAENVTTIMIVNGAIAESRSISYSGRVLGFSTDGLTAAVLNGRNITLERTLKTYGELKSDAIPKKVMPVPSIYSRVSTDENVLISQKNNWKARTDPLADSITIERKADEKPICKIQLGLHHGDHGESYSRMNEDPEGSLLFVEYSTPGGTWNRIYDPISGLRLFGDAFGNPFTGFDSESGIACFGGIEGLGLIHQRLRWTRDSPPEWFLEWLDALAGRSMNLQGIYDDVWNLLPGRSVDILCNLKKNGSSADPYFRLVNWIMDDRSRPAPR